MYSKKIGVYLKRPTRNPAIIKIDKFFVVFSYLPGSAGKVNEARTKGGVETNFVLREVRYGRQLEEVGSDNVIVPVNISV